MSGKSSYKKLFSNTLAMGLGQFSSKLLSFLLVPLYTAVLSTEQYGTYDLVVTTVTLLTPFLTLVISEAVMRFCMDKSCEPSHVLTVGCLCTVVGTGVLAAFYPLLCRIKTLGAYYSLWLIGFFFVINIHTVLTQFLKGIERVKFYSVCGIISTFLALTMNLLFLLVFKWSITGYFLASILSHLFVVIIIAFGIRIHRYLVNPFAVPKDVYRQMFKFSVPMIPNSISWWVSNSSCKYMLLYFSSASVVGIFSIAYKIPSILTIVITIFISAFQISIFENFGTPEAEQFFKKIYSAFVSLNVVVASGLIVFAKLLARILYQKDFFSAWQVSCVLIFAFVFNSLAALLGTVYSASKKTRFLFISTVIGAGMNILLNFVMIPWLGMHGAAIASLASYIVIWLLRLINVKRRFGYSFDILISFISFVLITVQIALMYLDTLWAILGAAGLFLIVFAINVKQMLKSDSVRRILLKFTKKNKVI